MRADRCRVADTRENSHTFCPQSKSLKSAYQFFLLFLPILKNEIRDRQHTSVSASSVIDLPLRSLGSPRQPAGISNDSQNVDSSFSDREEGFE